VVIALLGNPFSPAYARARDRGVARPLDFCSLHVALHGRRRSVWSLTERPIEDASRRPRELAIGGSRAAIEGDALVLDIDERTTPLPGSVRGRVVVHPVVTATAPVVLDAAGEHRWWPVAPLARVEVALTSPGVRFSGHGYHDANAGSVPIDASFSGWTWSRARVEDRVVVSYDVAARDSQERSHRLVFGTRHGGKPVHLDRGRRAPLPPTAWRLPRSVAADDGRTASVARTLTDSPFYARSLVRTRLLGQESLAMHEVLSADRLRQAWVRYLLGFRMARVGR
jgi:carotenoid 1,2-hydratase